ncbi:MAG: ABC transporter permease [Bacteroides sp.]|nr:ABC transporter permease [Bacteroides sp.]
MAASLARYNAASGKVEMSFLPPQTYMDQMFDSVGEETGAVFFKYTLVILVLLLVPGINLSGIAYSELRKRLPEIGIRKAFGATRREVMWRMLRENLLLSLLGGVLGLLLSYLSIFLLSDWLLASNFGESSSMTLSMFSPWIFGVAFLFCLLINLLSAGIPAWRAAGAEITTALNKEEL